MERYSDPILIFVVIVFCIPAMAIILCGIEWLMAAAQALENIKEQETEKKREASAKRFAAKDSCINKVLDGIDKAVLKNCEKMINEMQEPKRNLNNNWGSGQEFNTTVSINSKILWAIADEVHRAE